MKFYHWDRETLEYLEETEPEFDPVAGELMIPDYCTLEKPLPHKKNKAVIRIDNSWQYADDYRNIDVWCKISLSKIKIKHIGKIHETLTTKKPKKFSKWCYIKNRWIVDESALTDFMIRQREIYLASTDWYVIRQIETGIPVPTKIRNYRQRLRDITSHKNWPHVKMPKI